MRLKTFGLAAIAALAAMAFVGASTASATGSTALCKTLEDPCSSNPWAVNEVIHLEKVEPGKLLSTINVLCLTVLGNLQVEDAALANPLKVKGTFTYADCGTTAAHNNCKVEEKEPGLFDVLNVGGGDGVGTGLKGKAFVECKNILGFITISCEYEAAGLSPELNGANSHVTLTEQKVEKIKGGILCPEESKVDALLAPLSLVHVAS